MVILLWGLCWWSSKAGGIKQNLPGSVGFIALNPLQLSFWVWFLFCFLFFPQIGTWFGKRDYFGQKAENFQQDLNEYVLVGMERRKAGMRPFVVSQRPSLEWVLQIQFQIPWECVKSSVMCLLKLLTTWKHQKIKYIIWPIDNSPIGNIKWIDDGKF